MKMAAYAQNPSSVGSESCAHPEGMCREDTLQQPTLGNTHHIAFAGEYICKKCIICSWSSDGRQYIMPWMLFESAAVLANTC